MPSIRSYILVFVFVMLTSCLNRETKSTTVLLDTPSQETVSPTAPGIIPDPGKVKELEIIFYNKPFTDSIRYTRFYRFTTTSDSSVVGSLDRALHTHYEKLGQTKKCTSEGKIIMNLGAEEFRVAYFSRMNTDCFYVYLIKNGEFYYFTMTTELTKHLDRLERSAVAPK